jgi:DNA repair exonuclease SbcCD ATPase subunit
MDDIKKFLEDKQNHPDNTPVRIGDTEIPLGSLRQLNASERQTLSERLKGIETKETELNQRQAQVVDLAQKAQQAYNAAEEARKVATTRQADPGSDPFNDPWLQPVKTALSERDKKLEEFSNMVKGLQSTIGQAATIWAQDRWDREYDSLNFGKREKKPTRDELLKFAQEQKLVDRHGMPSVREAWNKMSEADRLEEARKEAIEKGREEGRMEAMAARVTAPGVSGMGQAPMGKEKPITPNTDILGDLYGDAIKDPELRALIEQSGVV